MAELLQSDPGTTASARTGALLLILWVAMLVVWWAFAFVPGNPPPDSWIAAARAACFGSSPTGLPEPYGWTLLLLAPLMLLGFMLAVFGAELREGLRLIGRPSLWRVALVVLVLGFVAELGWAAIQIQRGLQVAAVSYEPTITEELPDNYPRQDNPLPEFELVDQSGAAFDQTMMHGRPTVVTFAFAHCQTVCPVVAKNTTAAVEELGTGEVGYVLLTLDPWRDTPATLAVLAEEWGLPANARLLSGEPDAVESVLDAFNVARDRNETTGEVNHPPLVYVVDSTGRIAYMFNNPTVDWIVEGVRRAAPPS